MKFRYNYLTLQRSNSLNGLIKIASRTKLKAHHYYNTSQLFPNKEYLFPVLDIEYNSVK